MKVIIELVVVDGKDGDVSDAVECLLDEGTFQSAIEEYLESDEALITSATCRIED